MRWLLPLALGTAVLATAACSAVLDIYNLPEEPDSGADGSVSPDAAADAGQPGVDATTADARADGSTADADASMPDVDAGTWCQTQGPHALCSDFDEGDFRFDYSSSSLQWGFLAVGVGEAGLVVSAPMPIPSPPGAFVSTIALSGASAPSNGVLSLVLDAGVSTTHVTAEVLLSPPQAGQLGDGVRVILVSQSDNIALLTWDESGVTFSDFTSATPPLVFVSKVLPLDQFVGEWAQVELTVTLGTDGGSVAFVVNQQPLVDSVIAPMDPTASSTVAIGLSAENPTAATVYYDNVTVDLAP